MICSLTSRALVAWLILTACLLTCESNEIPSSDCRDCVQHKTELVTFSPPAWKDYPLHTTSDTNRVSTEKPKYKFSQQHTTRLVGTTKVITHGEKDPQKTDRGYTTQLAGSTGPTGHEGETTPHVGETTPHVGETTPPVGQTTPPVNESTPQVSETTTPFNKVTTKILDPTTKTPTWAFSPKFKSMLPISFELGPTTEAPTEEGKEKTTYGVTDVVTEKQPVPTPEATTKVLTTRFLTTQEASTGNQPTRKTEEIVTEGDITTTQGENVTLPEDLTTFRPLTTEVQLPTPDGNEGGEGENKGETEGEGEGEGEGGDDSDNDTNDQNQYYNNSNVVCHKEYTGCLNGGKPICTETGEFSHCLCILQYYGEYCELVDSVAKVEEPSGSFWEWKVSKYVIGGLGALALLGLIMMVCMVVKCARTSKPAQRRHQGYEVVGMETFLPPAPVVLSVMGAAGDRGSSDVMDERSEEEFHLYDSEEEGHPRTHPRTHRPQLRSPLIARDYPHPEDDGLLHHTTPLHTPRSTHRASPDHYKVPCNPHKREYMNMNGDAKHGPYMNGNANTYSHKLDQATAVKPVEYAQLNRSYSKHPKPNLEQHNYHNLP